MAEPLGPEQFVRIAPGEQADDQLRETVLGELVLLGLGDERIALACNVGEPTVKRWRENGLATKKLRTRTALDCLGAIIDHLRIDLRLENESIADFLNDTPLERISIGRYLATTAADIQRRFPQVSTEPDYSQPCTYVYHLLALDK